jgi:serine/threonine-protein kinase
MSDCLPLLLNAGLRVVMSDPIQDLNSIFRGRYRVERELGRGGMAIVYLAEDHRHSRRVAIKVLRREVASLLGAERFLREIMTSAQLTHPHILPVHDSGQAGDILYFVMPYFEGESLRDRLAREKRLSVQVALSIARDVASGLSYAHARGVIHRDIKPENILLEADEAVIADFGIARAIGAAGGDKLTSTGMMVGTPAYISPEQVFGELDIDGRSDQYGLGCVVFEMLAGVPPFGGGTSQRIVARHLTEEAPRLSTACPAVPAAVDQAVAKALSKNAGDRFQTAADFSTALQQATSPVPRGTAVPATSDAEVSVHRLSIAVLYLDNLSPDATDAYLADGLTEEITSRLADLPRLDVKGRSAVRRFRGIDIGDPAALGRDLRVRYLLEGSVRRAGRRVRASVRLLEAESGMRVWGKDYDRDTGDLLALQEDIAREIVRNIAGSFLPAEDKALAVWPTRLPAAYDHYLRGNYLFAHRAPSAIAQAITEFESAVRIDPGFSQALARVGHSYGLFVDFGWPYPGLTNEQLLVRGMDAADRAIQGNAASTDAWTARSYLLSLEHPLTFEGVLDACQQLMALQPRESEPYHEYGWILRRLGRDGDAAAAYRRALALEPNRPITLVHLADMSLIARRFAEARDLLDSAIANDERFAHAYTRRALAHLHLDDLNEARADAARASSLGPPGYAGGVVVSSLVEVREGDTTAAMARLERFMREHVNLEAPLFGHALWLPLALAAVGEEERALDLLDQIRPRRAETSAWLRLPEFDQLRSNVRFQRIFQESRPPGR